MELEDRAKMEMFLQEHESQLNLPPIQEGETIFEYVVAADGREVSYSKWHIILLEYSHLPLISFLHCWL